MKRNLQRLFLLMLLFSFGYCNPTDKDLNRDFLANLGLFWKRTTQAEISGTAVKGIVSGARVQILPLVNNACDRTGGTTPLAETTTDESGNYTVRYAKTGQPVCVLVTPASNGKTLMYDETQKKNISWNGSSFYLDSIIAEPSGLTSKGALSSPFSRMASRVFARTMQKADSSFANAVASSSSQQLVSMFGLNRGFIKGKSSTRSRDLSKPNDIHPRRFGKRAVPPSRGGLTRGKDTGPTRSASRTTTPTFEQLNLDFSKPDDPYVAKANMVLSGFSSLANSFATNASGRAISKGVLTRDEATSNGLETVMNGFSEVAESGGKRTTILKNVIQQATGRAPSGDFLKNPLEASMKTAIKSYVQNSGGGDEFGITANELDSFISMSTIPPADLWVDTSSAPDYLYYADNDNEGAMLLYTNVYESYYPWVEGGLPTSYAIVSGNLPSGMSLNPTTGEISGIATTVPASNPSSISIRATNRFGSTLTNFKIKVQSYVAGQAFGFVYFSSCTQSSSCTLEVGIEGVANWNYTITGFSSAGGSGWSVVDPIFGTISGTGGSSSGIQKGTVTYTDLNTKTTGSVSVDYYVESNVPTINVWGSYLAVGIDSYVAFEMEGVGEYGTYSFVPQDFGNGMQMDAFGSIFGIPTVEGDWQPTIQVILANGSTVSAQFSKKLKIGAAGTIPEIALGGDYLFYTGSCIELDSGCSLTIDSTLTEFPNGLTAADFTYEDTYEELYAYGLNIDSATGEISGTPTSSSVYATITLTDGDGIGYEFIAELIIVPAGGVEPPSCPSLVRNWGTFTDCSDGTVTLDVNAGTFGGESYSTQTLTWMKCAHGQTYDSGTDTCLGPPTQVKYCSGADETCNNGLSKLLDGTGTSEAYTACNSLNAGAGTYGWTDWRVPTHQELKLLIECDDPTEMPNTQMTCTGYTNSPTINSFFPGNTDNAYWSSSTYTFDTTTAWYIYFYNGLKQWSGKTNPYYLRCVR
ncbi:MAG: DUF1566 domain-containing protein [Leptospiraceae bacterium]|nr:DUF1566 domain-containing protein [Leptospiraceae bacterium]